MALMNTDAYQPHRDRYDEMLDANGVSRPHWRPLLTHLRETTAAQMRQRQEFVRSQVLENGVTYNMYASTQGAARPWDLDPLPLLLPASEWSGLATAVAQRARLLDAVLADLYGPQALLAEGLIPPATVYGHPDFLWPCRGLKPPGGRFLHLYAVDLARSADGQWWVIGDRAQAPSGAGYALENRLIVSHAFPELFRDLKVQHLAEFFRALRQNLNQHAPHDVGETPLTVLLTPGPFNETYFEHAYLARYLGFPLVEGQDLTVRGETVYLKTLTGLQRVHAILRRLDDDYCDPLELRGDSALGVPGLLQVARAGRVLIANAPGSGLVESGAIAAFLPRVCERLLGEPLAMPAVASWWCGEPSALDYVIEHLDELVIKPAYPSTTHRPMLGRDMRGKARAALILRLRKQPRAWVAQEIVRLSQVPVISHEHHLAARPVGLRMYATANTEGGYTVMPGGLARVAGTPVAQMISMQRGGGSKDTWVLSEVAVSHFSLLANTITARDLVRSPSNLSSRVVENLFWFGRYTSRCDDSARLLRITLTRFTDTGAPAARASALLLCKELGLFSAPEKDEPEPTPEDAIWTAICDEKRVESLTANLRHLAWTGTQIREHLSLDNWLVLNHLPHPPTIETRKKSGLGATLDYLDSSLILGVGLSGFAMDGMTRDNGWRFLMIGRHLERLAFMASATACFLHHGLDQGWHSLDWLLEVADSSITYRSRYRAQAELLPMLDLVVFDDTNPHGVVFQLRQLLIHLGELSADLGGNHHALADELQAVLQQYTDFDLATLERPEANVYLALAELLERTTRAARELSDVLAARHFTHVGELSRQTLAA
jgi:uncharacterized circularly permuted ATP-grasp superfamily protein/uncharacterized alpha-E superfamily protein